MWCWLQSTRLDASPFPTRRRSSRLMITSLSLAEFRICSSIQSPSKSSEIATPYSRRALEELNLKCTKLRSLKLGQFHGVCTANESSLESRLDGIALFQGLEALSIKNSADLTDLGLIAIARGCSRLAKFEVHGCRKITVRGMRTLACLLQRSLVEVKISCCKNLDTVSSLKALEPIQDLSSNNFSGSISEDIGELKSLSGTLNLSFNHFSGQIPKSMCMAKEQVALHVLCDPPSAFSEFSVQRNFVQRNSYPENFSEKIYIVAKIPENLSPEKMGWPRSGFDSTLFQWVV
ncbi:hypothetical protein CsSME_00044688 [Camellia sinensis var. sinensis]